MAEISFEIKEQLQVLSENYKGWTKEVNLISWNGRSPKVDIREWDGEHEKMSKGITLSKEELVLLKELLNRIDIDDLNFE